MQKSSILSVLYLAVLYICILKNKYLFHNKAKNYVQIPVAAEAQTGLILIASVFIIIDVRYFVGNFEKV